ncbi:MAG: oxidoreductase [Clostridia bacterium]|nr:oxidoreductase [Clostridia bacterium]
MERMHLIVDIAKCVGCFNCMLACKDEHCGNSWLPYVDEQEKHGQKWINPVRHERGKAPFTELCFVPAMCMHCADAPCAKKHPDCISLREDGIVMIDAKKAAGNEALKDACPYGRISWNGELRTAQKCTFCAHLIDEGWKEPRCVQACPLRALSVLWCEDEDFERIAEAQGLKALTGEASKPRVLYKNLYRLNKCFIAGQLAYMDGALEEAAVGASVQLFKKGQRLLETESDFLGEFKFDRLPPDSGEFTVRCELDGFRPVEFTVELGQESPCLPVMRFERL